MKEREKQGIKEKEHNLPTSEINERENIVTDSIDSKRFTKDILVVSVQ